METTTTDTTTVTDVPNTTPGDTQSTTQAEVTIVTTPDPAAATTPEVTPPDNRQWWEKVIGPDGKYVKGHQELLPPEMEEFKNLAATFDDPKMVWKALKDNMATARSKGNVKPITPESTPAEVADYRAKMGIPTEPYKIDKPEKLPEGVDWNPARAEAYGKWAHDNNLTPEQMAKGMELQMQFLSEDIAGAQQAHAQAMQVQIAQEQENLKLMYGGNLDKVVLAAQRAAMWGGVPAAALDPNSPTFLGVAMLGYFHKASEMLGESKLPATAVVANMDELAQARDIQTNQQNPDFKAFQQGSPATVKKVQDLIAAGLRRKGT